MAHFYLSDAVTDCSVGETVAVAGAEARHAVAVGRLRVGETLSVGDGRGTVAAGVVSDIGADRFSLEVQAVRFTEEPSPALWLAQALAKNDRDELAIQAATELGVDGVVPWAAGRSIVKWEGAKIRKHEERWATILREAGKQSMRSRIPFLRPLASSADIAKLGAQFHLVVLDPTGHMPLSGLVPDDRDILLVVGPEGGIAPAELSRFAAAGGTTARLGASILRASTAGPAAIAVLNGALGRW
ncbi:16S rRNA (uracil1498-N3)-methyltransferase [Cryobacterium mesophilum]|uniref:Ribosomal RNA small subunit methyltransferase E n=1 Tax=Terrimesophilobacter mesophilus TaxID=433647 RepID=A0A4V3I9E1_9MICO|nr:16S rRNA (uracil(1498)-N(3))-methyltransferase [Terrimesophilobacter mesophilus]MBB5632257.1 16S rRNA (uracil1498-N3)-methyltransferase [Terrimesophilobacter mesophilus]TFB79108.1 16S rRNA (uracil(1498)-N(3))-methyltransferase [Terrimesophilobacter mesophilus]